MITKKYDDGILVEVSFELVPTDSNGGWYPSLGEVLIGRLVPFVRSELPKKPADSCVRNVLDDTITHLTITIRDSWYNLEAITEEHVVTIQQELTHHIDDILHTLDNIEILKKTGRM